MNLVDEKNQASLLSAGRFFKAVKKCKFYLLCPMVPFSLRTANCNYVNDMVISFNSQKKICLYTGIILRTIAIRIIEFNKPHCNSKTLNPKTLVEMISVARYFC